MSLRFHRKWLAIPMWSGCKRTASRHCPTASAFLPCCDRVVPRLWWVSAERGFTIRQAARHILPQIGGNSFKGSPVEVALHAWKIQICAVGWLAAATWGLGLW